VWATDLRNANNHMLLCEERAPVLKVVYCTYKISYCAMFNYADGSYKNIAGWVFALL